MTTETITVTTVQINELPALGTEFHGGTFAGITTQKDGTHVAVILLPGKGADLSWKDAIAWAKEHCGELPTRPVAALLFANVHPALLPDWHWTADEYNASYAWGCDFDDGGQYGTHKFNELAAVAVRLIPLSS